ncbi:glycosyltransferase [Loktanella sp. M215]|uniref:glycosyltransferase n=1 Tax=Loktanella sp. M215 TaxID=2675431 RepID=UPI001F320222|nr:glycosyltransferase [Loktanella sp. M215]
MTPDRDVRTVVVIPARNEAARIGACLTALAQQQALDMAVVLVANNCNDGTETIARACAASTGLRLEVLSATLGSGAGVGTARRMGCDHALRIWPDADAVLSTDADCLTGADWIARNRHHLARVAAVCGRVAPMAEELFVLEDMDVSLAEMEGLYEALVTAFYRLHRPGPLGLDGDHGHAAGASLAVHRTVYQAVGGFADLVTGEDRDLVRRLKATGHDVFHAGDVIVRASCRLDGRAQDGMSAALRARADQTDYLIDDALPPAQNLIAAVDRGMLGPWPLLVAPQNRLRARDLAPHIAILEEAMRNL